MTRKGAGGTSPIESPQDLRAHFGPLSPLAEKKVLSHLDSFCCDFISLSPFLVIASTDGRGHADASPRGDQPGFVAVIDKKTLLIPDRRGNNRVDTFGNILMSPGIGLIFLVPGINETLRVNGRAEISQEPELLTPLTVQNVTPTIGLKVHVEEAYFHCGKALMRSKLWNPATQVERQRFPTLGRIIAEQTAAIEVEAAEKAMEEAYRTRLY
ncbi:MAG TPA: pyridoxamine 5'-phosphate oxidase family protein [Bradyrhizobium sp.]|nr:pyridoxamine 5'-phosphate oxidase family protein [Bradyrhizobium sp.]